MAFADRARATRIAMWQKTGLRVTPGLRPMRAVAAPALPIDGQDGAWAYEMEWGGVRSLLVSGPGAPAAVELQDHAGHGGRGADLLERYRELVSLGDALGGRALIVDGEIVALDPAHGRVDRGRPPRTRTPGWRGRSVAFAAFDLLHLDGHSVMHLPYEERRALLGELHVRDDGWLLADYQLGDGDGLLRKSAACGAAGVVAKRLGSRYEPGVRSRDWMCVRA